MTTATSTPPAPGRDDGDAPRSLVQTLIGRITRLEIMVAAGIAAILLLLVVIEPDILEAPFENSNTILFTVGGTVLAGLAFVVMLWLRVPALIRTVVLVVPLVIVNWWLLSPYFIDDVVDEEFSTSIAAQVVDDPAPAPAATAAPPPAEPTDQADAAPGDGDATTVTAAPTAEAPTVGDAPADGAPTAATEDPPPPAEPTGPVLLGAGQFVGLAGHDGTGDAGIFRNPDGSLILRFENFDIENGPDLEVYLVPGADQVDLAEGSIHLGALKGNIGDQNYELPAGTDLGSGPWTALVWCEAFSVEFVGATINV